MFLKEKENAVFMQIVWNRLNKYDLKFSFGGQSNSSVGNAFALHVTVPGSIPGIPKPSRNIFWVQGQE